MSFSVLSLSFMFLFICYFFFFFFFQAEDGIRDTSVTGVQTCALPIFVSIDVIETTVPGLKIMKEAGHFAEYYLPNASAYPAAAREAGSGQNIYWADRKSVV